MHAAAAHHDRARIVDQSRISSHQRAWHRDLHEISAVKVERDLLARAHRKPAQGHGDRPRIAHRSAEQRDIGALTRADVARVGYGFGGPIALEIQPPGHEVRIGDIQRAGDKAAAGLHRTGAGDGDTIGVHKVNRPVRGDLTRYGRCGIASHAVQRGAAGVGEVEIHAVARANREVLPVDDRVLASLVDGGASTIRGDAGAARGHGSAHRQGAGMRGRDDAKPGADQTAAGQQGFAHPAAQTPDLAHARLAHVPCPICLGHHRHPCRGAGCFHPHAPNQ